MMGYCNKCGRGIILKETIDEESTNEMFEEIYQEIVNTHMNYIEDCYPQFAGEEKDKLEEAKEYMKMLYKKVT